MPLEGIRLAQLYGQNPYLYSGICYPQTVIQDSMYTIPFQNYDTTQQIYPTNIGYPNFKGAANAIETLPTDTVEVAGKTKKKGKTKKVLLTIGGLITLGAGITYAVKKAQVKNIKNVQKIFQDVFLRDDITEKEAKEMLNRYKEIEKIKDNKEYIKALFEEAKKNYRLENTGIRLEFDLPCKGAKSAEGFYSGANNLISISTKQNRRHMLNSVHHELRHALQNKACASEYNAKLRALVDKYTTEFIEKTPDIDPTDPKLEEELKKIIEKAKTELKEKGFPKDDKELTERLNLELELMKDKIQVPEKYNDWVARIVESRLREKYVQPDDNFRAYYEHFKEKDARFAGSAIDKFVKGKAFSYDWYINKNGSSVS